MGRKTARLIKATPQLDKTERRIAFAIHDLERARENLRRFPCQREPSDAAVAKLERLAKALEKKCDQVQQACDQVIAVGCG